MPSFFFRSSSPPGPGPDKKALSAALTAAVNKKDINRVRRIFESAFWNKINLAPDWNHLLCAALKGDAAMARLLILNGAGWTEREARCLWHLCPDSMADAANILRKTSLRVPPKSNLQPDDIDTLLQMAKRFPEGIDDFNLLQKAKKQTEDALSDCIILHCLNGNIKQAHRVLRLRQPEGAVNFENEFKTLLERCRDCSHTINILDKIIASGLKIKPISIGFNVAYYPEAVIELNRRHLLGHHHNNRLYVIEAWVNAPKLKPYAKNVNDVYKAALAIMFKNDGALTESEIVEFISFRRKTDLICDELNAIGFFKNPAWTEEKMRRLVTQLGDASSLKKEFNRKEAQGRFAGRSANYILEKDNFSAFAEAHRKGYYQSTLEQSGDLLEALRKRCKKGNIPDDIKKIAQALKECGALDAVKNLYLLPSQSPALKKPEAVKALQNYEALRLADGKTLTPPPKAPPAGPGWYPPPFPL